MLIALNGVRVGHATDLEHLTGCTVVLFDKFFPSTCEPRGGVTACFFPDGIAATKCDPTLNGLFIAGGSVAGLTLASRIYDYLREQGHGKPWGRPGKGALVPRIAGAVVADRGLFYGAIDPELGYCACQNASYQDVPLGNVGAGTGTTVGKFAFSRDDKPLFSKSGVGGAVRKLEGGLIVAALTVVNSIGNVYDRKGNVVAGNRDPNGGFLKFAELVSSLRYTAVTDESSSPEERAGVPAATTVSIVGLNAKISHDGLVRTTRMAHSGLARAIRPVYTSLDGDTVFAFTTEEIDLPSKSPDSFPGGFRPLSPWDHFYCDALGHIAGEVVYDSFVSAVEEADGSVYDPEFGGTIPAPQASS